MNTFDRAPGSALDQALTMREAGDIDSAITLLFKAVGESLTDRGLVITLAKMLSETGQFDRAEHWFRHALKVAPDDLDVQFGYGTFLAETGRVQEARAHLGGAQTRARALLDDGLGDRRLVIAIELNLARAHFELDDHATARALIAPWLADEDGWGGAHDLFVDLAEKLGVDPIEADEEGLVSGQISPFMVCHRLEQFLEVEPPDLLGFERVVARADAIFDFDWRRCAGQIEDILARGRKAAVHAIMRGAIDADLVPHLLSSFCIDDAADADDADDMDEDADSDDRSDTGFAQLIRLAGWNDSDPGVQLIVVRRDQHFFLETSNQDEPIALAPHVVGWLVGIFARAIAGFPPPRPPMAIPVDRNWLVEGFGCSQVIRFDRFNSTEWPLVHAAMTLCQLESTLRSMFPAPNPPFTALVMATDPEVTRRQGISNADGLIEIKACLTDQGFVFARQATAGTPVQRPDEFFAKASPDLLSLVPELEVSFPCLVHPVAAWVLIGAALAMDVNGRGSFRGDWMDYCDKPVRVSGHVASRDFAELGL